jgi:hypothetical protein
MTVQEVQAKKEEQRIRFVFLTILKVRIVKGHTMTEIEHDKMNTTLGTCPQVS